jgi:DNA-directed RNA polymerase subunit alpha
MEYRSLHLPDRVEWDEDSLTDKQGRLVVAPLERGFGRTLGNALRRVLLSSLEGAAPVSVRIEGADHEFTSLPGVYQDVPDIILNIKSLDINHTGTGPGRLHLDVKGPAVVKGSDLKADSFLKVLNGSQMIAEVAQGGRLKLEIIVQRGKGYVTAEEWYDVGAGREIGDILLDSWFGPVRKVNYEVDSARVGDRTDFDKLMLEVETDGSIDPREAVSSACDILTKHFELILGGESVAAEEEEEEESEDSDQGEKPLRETGLSMRLVNSLAAAKIETLSDLASMTPSDLLSLRNFGQASLKIIQDLLEQYGLQLSED